MPWECLSGPPDRQPANHADKPTVDAQVPVRCRQNPRVPLLPVRRCGRHRPFRPGGNLRHRVPTSVPRVIDDCRSVAAERIDDSPDAGPVDRARAHRARLGARVQWRPEDCSIELHAGRAHQVELGVALVTRSDRIRLGRPVRRVDKERPEGMVAVSGTVASDGLRITLGCGSKSHQSQPNSGSEDEVGRLGECAGMSLEALRSSGPRRTRALRSSP